MRFRLAVAVVILQVLVLAYMAGQREGILRAGRVVTLRTAPIDPNDPMRGDYARLAYDISRVPRALVTGNLLKRLPAPYEGTPVREERVYARLKVADDGVAELEALTDEKPADGLFIRGVTANAYGPMVEVRYGIEALFMQQGGARTLEDTRVRDRPGVPLDVDVALGSSGTAVLKDHHWEPLGLTVTFDRTPAPVRGENVPPPPGARPPQVIIGVDVELKNYGPEDVAIVDLPDGGSFRLVADERWREARFRWVGEKRAVPPPEPAQVLVLKPGQSHRTKIDLTRPSWFVVNVGGTGDARPVALREVTDPWSLSFRVEYAPPSKAAAAHLPQAELIRHGRLQSRAFTPTAGVD